MSQLQTAALTLVLTLHAGTPAAGETDPGAPSVRVVVIGHRGASGLRPEHTLAAYRLAAEQGADFIEPDLVITRDGHLIARHENELSDTTDVASRPEFANRRTTRRIDGREVNGWFSEDFTLAEIRTLAVRERIAQLRPDNVAHEANQRIPTLREILDWLQEYRRRTGRDVGVYPETKHPSHFRAIGLPLEPRLLDLLREYGWDTRAAPVIVQSFEVGNLQALARQTPLRLVQLFGAPDQQPPDLQHADDPRTYADLATPAGLARIATYAWGIGPPKTSLIPRDARGRSQPPTPLLADAHAAGLVVHPYTFRDENLFLPLELRVEGQVRGRAAAEYLQFYELGVDGLFSDHPATAVRARAVHRARRTDTP